MPSDLKLMIVTADRPRALRRCIASVVRAECRSRRGCELAIFDNGERIPAAAATVSREWLQRHGVRLEVHGARTRAALSQVLVDAGCDRHAVGFALQPHQKPAMGANRNVGLLYFAGRRLVSLDDDVVANMSLPASYVRGTRIVVSDPRRFEFRDGRGPFGRCRVAGDESFSAAHAFALGRSAHELDAGSEPSSAAAAERTLRVRLVMNSVCGHDTLNSTLR